MAIQDIKSARIIFNNKKKTVQDIFDLNYCNFCGACKLVCPVNAIEYSWGKISVNDSCIHCGKCLEICSQNQEMKFVTNLIEKENNSKIQEYDKELRSVPFGAFKDIYICETLLSSIRERAMLGGVTLSILSTAMEIGLIDSALVVDFEKNKLFPSGKIVKTEKQLLKSGGSKYLPTFSLEKLEEVLLDDDIKAIGVTTLPCQAYVIKKLKENPATAKYAIKIKLVLTLFCGSGLPSRNEVEKHIRKKGMSEPLEEFSAQNQRINRLWRLNPQDKERYIFTSKKGKQYDFSSRRILSSKSKQNCRRLCSDYSGYYSDISIGGSSTKTNVVVVRTEIGENVFRESLGRKKIKRRNISKWNHLLIKLMGKNKRKKVKDLLHSHFL